MNSLITVSHSVSNSASSILIQEIKPMLKRIFTTSIAAAPASRSRSANRPLEKACVAVALLVLSIGAFAQTPAPQNEFVIRNARIFDGSHVIPNGDVWVRNGMIEAVGPRIKTPSGIRAIDASGRTLVPGLIDAHVHTLGMDKFLKSALALGVTTELDMGTFPKYADEIEKQQAQGKRLDLADLRSSRYQPTAPDGHGTEYGLPIPTVSSPAEAEAVVDSLVAQKADFIGEIVYDDGSEFGLRIPTLTKENLRAVIEAAHRHGKLAVVHILSEHAAKDAIAAGADGLAHLFADQPPDEEFVSLARERHIFVIPTLSVLAAPTGASAGPSLARDPRLEPYLSVEAIGDLNQDMPRHSGSLDNTREAVRRLNAKGVPILAGTDGHNPGTAHGASVHGELQMLVDSGLTPIQALAAATWVNASAFQMNDRGQIAPGKRADLLLVDGNPTTRISDISNVVAVWKLGVEFNREAYRAELDREKEAERNVTLSAPPGSESGLISDFEDGTPAAAFGLGWNPSAGRLLGGHSPEARIAVVDGGAKGSKKALEISGEMMPGIFGWAGAMFFPGSAPMAPMNLSNKSAISFWTKGDGRTYQVMLWAKSKGALPLTKSFTAGSEWTRFSLPLSDFGTDGHDLKAIMFAELAIPGKFTFEIDEVRLEPSVPSAADPAQAQQAPTGAAPRPAASLLPVGSPRQPGAGTYAPPDNRAFGFLPNYKTVEPGTDTEPLTAKQKFVMATKDTFDPPILLVSGGLAGISQAKGQDPSYGQGTRGYLKRFGAGLADQVFGNYLVESAFPTLLRQDPRFYRKGTGSVGSRTAYALTRVLVTRTDSGRSTINFSDFAGNAISAGIGNIYYPDSRGMHDNLRRWTSFTLTEALGDVMKEFWPDIKRRFVKRRNSGL
jgi:imidazolonepropionase-like amidohydrolase